MHDINGRCYASVSLGLDTSIFLNVDMVIGLENIDMIVRILDTDATLAFSYSLGETGSQLGS